MKKVIAALVLLGALAVPSFADNITDPFTFLQGNAVLAITQHGSLSYEYGERGSKNISLLDNVAEAVKFKNTFLLSLDAGIDGATLPQTGQTTLAWTAGAKINLNALTDKYIQVAPQWTFIKSLEYSVRYAYESALRKPRATLVIAYGFGPGTPK